MKRDIEKPTDEPPTEDELWEAVGNGDKKSPSEKSEGL
jgi:hypothetical protein